MSALEFLLTSQLFMLRRELIESETGSRNFPWPIKVRDKEYEIFRFDRSVARGL